RARAKECRPRRHLRSAARAPGPSQLRPDRDIRMASFCSIWNARISLASRTGSPPGTAARSIRWSCPKVTGRVLPKNWATLPQRRAWRPQRIAVCVTFLSSENAAKCWLDFPTHGILVWQPVANVDGRIPEKRTRRALGSLACRILRKRTAEPEFFDRGGAGE